MRVTVCSKTNNAQEVESSQAALHNKEAACQAAQDEVVSNRLQLEASRYQHQHLSACFACIACYAAQEKKRNS